MFSSIVWLKLVKSTEDTKLCKALPRMLSRRVGAAAASLVQYTLASWVLVALSLR